MDILTTIVVLIPSILSLCVSGIYAYIALKKAKEPPKDEIWETATKLICASGHSSYSADEFADLYEQLKLFKDNGCSMKGFNCKGTGYLINREKAGHRGKSWEKP